MSRATARGEGLIGPNAILQLLPVLDAFGGVAARREMLARAGLSQIPDGSEMIPEEHARRLHRQLREDAPAAAPALAARAGTATANYILAHRIPTPAQRLLRILPAPLAARALARAIAGHAWTFAGSGAFRAQSPWVFEIKNNPLIRGAHSETCLCDWHAAVFARLYQHLVAPDCTCRETACGAQSAHGPCRFEITRSPNRSPNRSPARAPAR